MGTSLSPVVKVSNGVKSKELLSPRTRLRDEVDSNDDPSSKRN